MTPEQYDKLPKHVQVEITKLRMQVETLTARNQWLEDENRLKVKESNTVIVNGITDYTAIQPFSQVEFRFPDDERHWRTSITARLRRDGGGLEIMGTRAIIISPQASNVAVVTVRED